MNGNGAPVSRRSQFNQLAFPYAVSRARITVDKSLPLPNLVHQVIDHREFFFPPAVFRYRPIAYRKRSEIWGGVSCLGFIQLADGPGCQGKALNTC